MKNTLLTAVCLVLGFSLTGNTSCSRTPEEGTTPAATQPDEGDKSPILYFAGLMNRQEFSISDTYRKFLASQPQFLRYPIDHEGRSNSIFHHPLEQNRNTIVFSNLEIGPQAAIETDIGVFIKGPDRIVSDGVGFRIIIRSGEEEKVVLDEVLREFNRWKGVSVALSEYAGRKVSILFETDPAGSSAQDWAAWGSPRLIQTGVTREFDSKDYDSAQRYRGLVSTLFGASLAGGSRTDRGWFVNARTTEIRIPKLPPKTIIRTELYVLYPAAPGQDELQITLLGKDDSVLKSIEKGTGGEGTIIVDEFDPESLGQPVDRIRFTLGSESPPSLFIKQPVFRMSPSRRDSQPNVILISLDTLRPDYLGCYGSKEPYSPNIDRLASESLLFKNAYSTSNWTLPAHTSLFTSLYSTDHQAVPRSWGGSSFVSYEDEHFYITEAFKEASYVTLAFTGGGFVDSRYGFNRAFDYHVENVSELNFETLDNLLAMVEANRDVPHFLFFHTFEVHDYLNQKPKYVKYVTKPFFCGKLSLERRLSSQHFLDLPRFKNIAADVLPEEGVVYARQLYAGAVSRTDELIGRFLGHLRQMDLYDQSWIILLSDHGEGFGERHSNGNISSWRHGWRLYNDQVRIPLIIKPPRDLVKSGLPRVESQLVDIVDIAPTLSAVLGRKPPPQFKGRNLLPAFRNPDSIQAKAAFSDDLRNRQFSVFAEGYKLLAFPNPSMMMETRYELYNLAKDPAEFRNLVKDLKDSQLLADLQALLQEHARSVESVSLGSASGLEQELDREHLERLRELGYIQ